MNIGFVGLGKLGLPISVAICNHTDCNVYAYDSDLEKIKKYGNGEVNLYEPNIREQLHQALNSGRYNLLYHNVPLMQICDIIFIAVPTPTLKNSNKFDLGYVEDVVADLGQWVRLYGHGEKPPIIVIISTVLPGDTKKHIVPVLESASGCKVGDGIGLCYSAQFIAMGTCIEDYLTPEFVLIGESDVKSGAILEHFYRKLYGEKMTYLHMTWEEAELTKMVYNTMIGFKIVYANALMEIAHKIGNCNCDVVSNAISLANKRLVSKAYLRGGMGDGGGCHPRDNLALGDLANDLDLSSNPFNFVIKARNDQAQWISNIIKKEQHDNYRPVVLMSLRYKPNTNLTDYSASILVKRFLHELCDVYDPLLYPDKEKPKEASVFLIGHMFDFIHDLSLYPSGSTIIDPWRCFSKEEMETLILSHVKYIPIGVS